MILQKGFNLNILSVSSLVETGQFSVTFGGCWSCHCCRGCPGYPAKKDQQKDFHCSWNKKLSELSMGATTFSRVAFFWVTCSLGTVIRMPVGTVALSLMKLSKMTLKRMTQRRMTLRRMTVSRMTQRKMPVIRMPVRRMPVRIYQSEECQSEECQS